jgi:hypothetical protein
MNAWTDVILVGKDTFVFRDYHGSNSSDISKNGLMLFYRSESNFIHTIYDHLPASFGKVATHEPINHRLNNVETFVCGIATQVVTDVSDSIASNENVFHE